MKRLGDLSWKSEDQMQMRPSNTAGVGSIGPTLTANLNELLNVEGPRAEATLGRALVDPTLFAFNCWVHGLGHALNHEQGLI